MDLRILAAGAALALALCATTPAIGHHSFAMFDSQAEMWLEGRVIEFQWTNPHTFIQLAVRGEDGKVREWSLEGGSPGILSRNGWNRLVLKSGDQVRVLIYPLRTGDPGGSFVEVHRADGKVFYYHG